MMVSTSDKGDPAKINFRMLSTDLLENKSDSLRVGSTLDGACTEGDCVVVVALTTRLSSFSREVLSQQHPMTKRMRRSTDERLLYFGIGLAMSAPA
jgi:hypothetical protein